MTAIPLPVVARRPVWRVAQWLGVILTVVLLVALVAWPQGALAVLWDMVIPLLPATFLLNPLLWRNVCPLATLNELVPERPRRLRMEGVALRSAWTVGITLLFAMVPARRFLFNEHGPALAATVTLVALLALAGGAAFSRRAGFCGSICPVLPVEKLYGQAPLLPMRGARCGDCVRCTGAGCIELAGSRAVPQTIGPMRRDTRWLRSSFGVFAAAFPGFIIGYFSTVNGDLSTAAHVYARVLGFAAASYVIVALVTLALSMSSAVAMRLLGAASIGAYYWYCAPNLTVAYHAPSVTTWVVRGLMGLVLAWWLAASFRSSRQAPVS